jgi:squalene-hopene/tetraprenyl-beta-curcumene cyclase
MIFSPQRIREFVSEGVGWGRGASTRHAARGVRRTPTPRLGGTAMSADAAMIRRARRIATITVAAAGCAATAAAGDAGDPSRIRRAISYLDARQDDWSRFAKAQRGEGADSTTCVSCHTGISYALARPVLRRFAARPGPAAPEERMVAAVRLRVEHWAELDSPRFRLMYDGDDRKKAESRGTEAVVNALILARDDATRGRPASAAATRTALQHLWVTQTTEGSAAGSWDWLNFGLEPWEADGSRVFGAALAAIAVGSAPGYLDQRLDEGASRGVRSLRDYLHRRFPEENLYNRLWILEASTTIEGLLSADQRREVVDQLFAVRRDDGGWALATLGNFKRVDGTPQVRDSDGYATGLVLHALLRAGSPSVRPEVAQGLGWLRSHQQDDGSWRGRSVNKERDTATFVGKLMSDAATAIAALALIEAESR